jgi:hypothetical protein
MGPPLATLAQSDIERFERDGYVVVKQAFPRADAFAMETRWWAELELKHRIRREDRSTWRQIPGDLKAAKRDPVQVRILSDRVRGVFDDLLGKDAWEPPKDWGRAIATFPEPGEWDVPSWFWHWDNPCELHLDRPTALLVVSFVGAVAPRSGGTLILAGSPRLLLQQERRRPPGVPRDPKPWNELYRSHPWLMALAGQAPSPAVRIAAFMDQETVVDGVPLRVVELTGEPGDMVLCHPCMVHCGAPNRGERPRFMRIRQQVFSHEGRKRFMGLHQPGGAQSS